MLKLGCFSDGTLQSISIMLLQILLLRSLLPGWLRDKLANKAFDAVREDQKAKKKTI